MSEYEEEEVKRGEQGNEPTSVIESKGLFVLGKGHALIEEQVLGGLGCAGEGSNARKGI